MFYNDDYERMPLVLALLVAIPMLFIYMLTETLKIGREIVRAFRHAHHR